MKHKLGAIVSGVVSIGLLGGFVWAGLHAQYIKDYIVSKNYHPSAAIVSIKNDATMTSRGQFYFYASQPSVDEAAQFNNHCKNQEQGNAILGCYSGQRVYIYSVTNSQLAGIENVTAAHETLHAIWQRTSPAEKKRLTDLLNAAYDRVKDKSLETRMTYYAKAEPGERVNELHSILGTEYANLGPELENYYSQYFSDRSKIVAYHTAYQAVFDQVEQQATTLANQLNDLAKVINAKTAQYNVDVTQLNSDIATHNASAETVDRTNASAVDAFNTARQQLIARANQLSQAKAEIDNQRSQYDQELVQYRQVTLKSDELNQSITSTPSTSPTVK